MEMMIDLRCEAGRFDVKWANWLSARKDKDMDFILHF
jgi:hypothetical protein